MSVAAARASVLLRAIGGDQDFARILVENRTVFPGPGGVIVTKYPLKCAFRQERVMKGKVPNTGLKLFLRHLLIKKLDDLFVITGRYRCPHVAAPYGVVSQRRTEGYIYQWTPGCETFPWELLLSDEGFNQPVHLEEWPEFIRAFREAGIDLERNVVMSDSRNAQNIIHDDGQIVDRNGRPQLSAAWRRIDFGEESATIDYEKLLFFLDKNKNQIKENLSHARYHLIWCVYLFLSRKTSPPELPGMIIQYRLSALEHSQIKSKGQSYRNYV